MDLYFFGLLTNVLMALYSVLMLKHFTIKLIEKFESKTFFQYITTLISIFILSYGASLSFTSLKILN